MSESDLDQSKLDRISPARLVDVARAAGVSIATVSRAMNQPDLVRPSTLRSIKEAIAQFAYVPNGAARTLVSHRSRTIGTIIPTIRDTFAAQTIGAFEQIVGAEGYSLLLGSSENNAARALNLTSLMVERNVDALFLITYSDASECYSLLDSKRIPYVMTGPRPKDHIPHITYDHRRAALLALDHLLSLGHRNIGLLLGPTQESHRLQQRIDAVMDRLKALGLPPAEGHVVELQTHSLVAGREGFRAMQASGPLPSAILATNDYLAAGAIFEAQKQGMSVPGDISITGYGDAEIAGQMIPPLLTIRTPRARIGELAGQYLLSRLSAKRPSLSVMLDVEFVEGGSTAAPAASTSKKSRKPRR